MQLFADKADWQAADTVVWSYVLWVARLQLVECLEHVLAHQSEFEAPISCSKRSGHRIALLGQESD